MLRVRIGPLKESSGKAEIYTQRDWWRPLEEEEARRGDVRRGAAERIQLVFICLSRILRCVCLEYVFVGSKEMCIELVLEV